MIEINLLEDNSEIVPYNFADFAVHARKYSISHYPNMSSVSHWHKDLEFIIILKGRILYSVDGADYLLEEGQGIFVNSKHLHYGHSYQKEDCQFLCMLFHPSLLNVTEAIKKAYTESICRNSSLAFYIFDPETSWHKKAIKTLEEIFFLCQKEELGFELSVLSHLYSLWLTIFQNIKLPEIKKERLPDKRLEALSLMIGYIQKNYGQRLVLNDIASAGNVCRSSCCNIFSALLNMTPTQYLTHYRLERSLELLSYSSLSITEIALCCGFNSSSYFTEVFHKEMGCTPTQYCRSLNTSINEA